MVFFGNFLICYFLGFFLNYKNPLFDAFFIDWHEISPFVCK